MILERRHIMNKITGLILLTFFLTSCDLTTEENKHIKWFDQTKNEILNQSNLTADSTFVTLSDDSVITWTHNLFKGQEFSKEGKIKEKLRIKSYFSKSADFELRQEICDNGLVAFEGILFKDKFYGLSKWKDCQDRIQMEGIRFEDEKVGIWKIYNDKGQVNEETDYGHYKSVDLFPKIK